jgi:hypothetical protein
MRRSLATVAGLALAALAVPGTAHAASIRTQFTEFTITPLQSDIDHPRTYAGRLVYKDADGTEHGLAGATVALREPGTLPSVAPIATTTTDGEGRFSGSVNYAYTRSLTMTYKPPSGSDYSYVLSDYVRVYAIPVASRISVSVAPKPKIVGDVTTVSGLVERVRPDGSWVVLPGQTVRVYYVPSDTQSPTLVTTTTTASDGTYRAPVAIPALYGRIMVDDHTYDDGSGPYKTATAWSAPLTLSYYRTRIVGFDAGPEPVKKGRTLTVGGTLQWYAKTWHPLNGVNVTVYFKRSGSKSLAKMATVTSDRSGRWQKKFKAAKDGTWYAVARAEDPYLPIATSGDYVDVR